MRAGAALVIPALLLLSAPRTAPMPASRAPSAPLLLVLRSACGTADASLFEQKRLERYASETIRFSQLPVSYRLLSREETCGAGWEEAVTRRSLEALGAGGGVVAAGRMSARVCGAVGAAAVSLRRPQPAPCGEVRARGAALAHLARRLRWRRALLAATRPSSPACEPALRETELALGAVGVAALRALDPEDDEVTRPAHVVIVCESSIEAPSWPRAAAPFPDADVLLLRLAAPPHHDTRSATGRQRSAPNGNLLSTPHSKSVTFATLNQQLDHITKVTSTDVLSHSVSNKTTEPPFGKNVYWNINTTEMISEEQHQHTSDFVHVLGDRLLMLSDETLETKHGTQSLYDDILAAALLHEEATQTGIQKFRINFNLFKIMLIGGNWKWSQVGIVGIMAQQPLGAPHAWSASVQLDEAVEQELRRRGALHVAEDAAAGAAAVYAAVLALSAACALCALLAATAAWARRSGALGAPRRPRASPVLAAADFQFPFDERRRVGEGMETMLSWLQQLHDVSDPEPERPDLLQRPAPPVSAPSSTCSVTRLAPDSRTRYKGDPVHIKYLPAATLDLRRKTIDVLLVMQSLRHENLNPFIGCLTEVRPALVWEACGRGSLEDVLVADDISLDWTFRLSLLTDLVRGMRYLHASPVRVHARLSSRNCVVDARWVLRVTDYGLPALASAQALPYPPRKARDLLWTAPELLREANSAAVPGGTQAGDVFSFGIIMQEVIVRGEPYCMLSLSPEEIVEKLRHPPPLVRPSVSLGAAPPDAVAVMRQCWSEQPDLRPEFPRLAELFRHMHRGRKTNIVDSMFEMLEKYSNNLEELIKDRTEQLDMEKKKTEQLLNRMLPRTVAERLLLGLRVEPEEFEDVSIYFSDIVGFTALAARSSPVQVVDLLNDLYTTFDAAIEQYRVYKVETIGDAYMVVGGLPLRCADHAERVATMALHLLHLAGRFRIRHLPATPLHLRIGLHSGPCCAGVVGLTMPRYCLFGDTVNTAARMESTGAAWRVQVSGATGARLAAAGGYRLRSRGLTQVKGKGAMLTYWLLGKDGFDKPLPTPPPLETEEVLFEAEGENDGEASPGCEERQATPSVERQCSDPSPTADKFAWRSGAVSAESSPPAPRRPRYLRSCASTATAAGLLDTPRLSERWTSGGTRVLRRQWSLERGDALAAAAAESPATPAEATAEAPRLAMLEPLAFRAAPSRAAPPRYRTRRVVSTLDVSR